MIVYIPIYLDFVFDKGMTEVRCVFSCHEESHLYLCEPSIL